MSNLRRGTVDAAEQERRADQLLGLIRQSGEDGVTLVDLASALGWYIDTVRRYLGILEREGRVEGFWGHRGVRLGAPPKLWREAGETPK